MSYIKTQAREGVSVQPNNNELISKEGKEIRGCVLYIGTGGDLVVLTQSGDELTFKNISDGTFLPVQVIKVLESTTADDIIALW